LGPFRPFLAASAAENDVFPKKKRDEDDLLRFSFYLVVLLKELSKKPANVTSTVTSRTSRRYGTRANPVTYIHECPLDGRPVYGWEKPRYSFRKRGFAHTKPNSPALKAEILSV